MDSFKENHQYLNYSALNKCIWKSVDLSAETGLNFFQKFFYQFNHYSNHH